MTFCGFCEVAGMAEYIDAKKMVLAMLAGARAIENNKRLWGAYYCYDVFGVCGDHQEISYYEAAKTLREAAEKAIGDDTRPQGGKGRMDKYIKREALYKELETWRDAHADIGDGYGRKLLEDVLWEVNAQPGADVAPVWHGGWVRQPSEIPGLDVEFCSECGQGMNERNQFWNAKWCPACGARMDKAATNG